MVSLHDLIIFKSYDVQRLVRLHDWIWIGDGKECISWNDNLVLDYRSACQARYAVIVQHFLDVYLVGEHYMKTVAFSTTF